MYLYKYVNTQTGISILKNLSIRFTQPNQLNDPFEMCAPIITKDITTLNYPDTFFRKLPDEERKLETIQIQSFEFQNEVLSHISRLYGIACFSYSSKNLLLWSHYANSHQGICIQFKVDNNFLKLGEHFKVKYSTNRPMIDTEELYNNYDYLIRQMSQKSKEWAYEKEYRLYSLLSGCMKNGDTDIYTRKFDISNLGSVILGYRCNHNDQKQILRIMKSYNLENNVFQSRLSTDVFNLFYDDDLDIENEYDAAFNHRTGDKKYFIQGSNSLIFKDDHEVFYKIDDFLSIDDQLSEANYYFNNANIFFDRKNYFKAIEFFKKCYHNKNLDEKDLTLACFYIASSYYNLKDYTEAITWYQKTISLNKLFLEAYKKLVFSYAFCPYLGNINRALEDYSACCLALINLDYNDIGVDIFIFVAGIYYNNRNFDASWQLCERAKKIEKDNLSIVELEKKIIFAKSMKINNSNSHIPYPINLEDNGVKIIWSNTNFIELIIDQS